MKKNITINLCGRLFAIDEDAYEMLSTYEQSLRNYFRTRDGGEEIAEDIEARIAELLDEVKQSGSEAITIDHVREVIHRIGKPEEMEEEAAPLSSPEGDTDATSSTNPSKEAPSGAVGGTSTSKRLYRNPADKKLLGVLSGFAAYFGGDVLWWRLGYVGLFMLTGVVPYVMPMTIVRFVVNNGRFDYTTSLFLNSLLLIFLYVVFAVLMPVAETPEDRLRMKGKEVNPQNLAEEIASPRPTPDPSRKGGETSGLQGDNCAQPHPSLTGGAGGGSLGHKGPRGCVEGTIGCIGGFFVALWTVIATLFRWCIYACGVFLAGLCLFGIVCLAAVALNPIEWFHKGGMFLQSQEFDALIPSLTVPFYIFVIAAFVVLAITAYAIIHSLLNELRQMPSMPYRQRIALLVMWILGLVAAGAACGYGLPKFIDAENDWYKRERQEQDAFYRYENTHDGIYIQPHEWEWLQDNGWKILNAEGCHDRFTTTGQHYKGDGDARYLDCYDSDHRQRYRAERTATLQPGTYQLTCAARTNGTGVCIYAIVGEHDPIFKEIPASGNEGGDIWKEAKWIKKVAKNSTDTIYNKHYDEDIARANHLKGFGWNRITIEPIRIIKPTVIRYGLTSDDAFTGKTWLGQWFSATDFEVSRINQP